MSLDQRYVAHLREAARPADHYTCSLCQQRPPFLSRQEFLEHLESHSDELEVLCRDPNFDVETWGESQRSKVKRRNADPTSPPLRSSATQLMLPSVHWSGRKVRELWHPDSSSRRESSDTRCYPGMMDASNRGSHEDPPKRSSAHGGICMPIDPRWPDILLQPESRPISQEQLAAEVKSIYVGLTMVESKCIHVDKAEASATRDFQGESKISNEHWQALIALHRTLLHEHHDFFLAAQHPSASPSLRRLASKYPMPARMWKHGIHSFLDLLRYRLPESVEYMISFIYTAYQMMSLLYETVPAFENAWIECLGDLGRYRKALEDVDVHDRENWADVARFWYDSASNKSPDPGRLYHHLDILARPIPPQQVPPPKWPPIRCSAFAHNRHPISTLLGKRLLNERDIELFHFCKFHHSMYQQRKQGEPLTDLGTQFWSRILSISGRQLYSMRCNFYQRTRHQAWIKSTPQIVPEMRNARGDFPYEDLSLELYASTPNERHCEGCARYTQHLCEQQQGNSVCKVGLQTETLTNDVKRHIRGSQKGSFQGIVGFIRFVLYPATASRWLIHPQLVPCTFLVLSTVPTHNSSSIILHIPDIDSTTRRFRTGRSRLPRSKYLRLCCQFLKWYGNVNGL